MGKMWISTKDKRPYRGQAVKYKGELWKFGVFQHLTKGKCKYNGKDFETPDGEGIYTKVTHWAE